MAIGPIIPIKTAWGAYWQTTGFDVYAPSPLGSPPGALIGSFNGRLWPDLWAARQNLVVATNLLWDYILMSIDAPITDGRDGVYGPLAVQPGSNWIGVPFGAPTDFFRVVHQSTVYRGEQRSQHRSLLVHLIGQGNFIHFGPYGAPPANPPPPP